MAAYQGTPNPDPLTGTEMDDTFNGLGGNDTITGLGGADAATFNISTDGADQVDLGAGDDVVLVSAAAPGQVRLTFTSAEVGNGNPNDSNTMTNQDGGLAVRMQLEDGGGTPGGPTSRYDDEGVTFESTLAGLTFDVRDLVSGVARGDKFEVVRLGTSGGDVIDESGEGRSYYINAGGGADTLTGGDVSDFLVGGGGDDSLAGGDGADSFIGGGGGDIVSGGMGDDRMIFNVSTDGADSVNLGSGDDSVQVSAAAAGQIRLTFTSAEVGDGNSNDSNSMANQDGGLAVRLQLEDGSGIPAAPLSRFDDEGISFVATTAGLTFDVRDLVSGVARGDQFKVVRLGTQQNDVVDESGKTVSYYINAGGGNDTVTGSEVNDFLVGGGGLDRLRGGQGDDQFLGGGGNDTVEGGSGADTLDGGLGDDQMRGGAGDDTYVVDSAGDTVDEGGGSGTDTVRTSLDGYTLRTGVENLVLTGTANLSAFGSSGSNVLTGNSGANKLDAGAGSDTASGGGGADTLIGGSGDDNLRGEADADLLDGGSGNDWLDGGEAADTLNGGSSADTLTGGAGDDWLTGGSGGDRFVFAVGSGDDLITDFRTDIDELDISAQAGATYAADGGDTLISFADGGSVRLTGVSIEDFIGT